VIAHLREYLPSVPKCRWAKAGFSPCLCPSDFPQPLYSTNFTPCGFDLFPQMMGPCHIKDITEIKVAALYEVAHDYFHKYFRELYEWWHKCVVA
jgi:hypothetical protein